MARLARMHEHGRRAGGGEGRGDLAGDVTGLADAGDDHAAAGVADGRDRGGEVIAKTVAQRGGERIDAAAFRIERAQRGFDRGLRALAAHIGSLRFDHSHFPFPVVGFDTMERRPRQGCALNLR